MSEVALAVMAHPDDAEFLCAGALLRLHQEHGWHIHLASMTPGDCGSAELPPAEISAIRCAEGNRAATLVNGRYHCLQERDLLITFNEPNLARVTRLLREVRPRLVFTHSPQDYLVDHETTSTIVRSAVFAAPVPNFLLDRGLPPALGQMPYLYYCDAIEGKDLFGSEVQPGFCVDVSSVMETKCAMLAAHASQRDWLLLHHGMDHYLESLRTWNAHRGQAGGVAFAEGYRQHLGHGYPQNNLLGELLGTVG